MGVLHIKHRVVVVLRQRQIDVEHVFGVGLAAEQEKPHRIFAGPLDQITQSDIAARAFGNFDFLATAHHPHHGVQHIVGVAGGDAHIRRLQARTHPGNGAVVVGALDVDHAGETALPLGDVIGHIGHKVGVAAVAFAHHPVFVVAVIGAAQPQGAVLLIGLARGLQALHRLIDPATGVQAGLEVVVVKAHRKSAQVQVLLMAQVSHGKLAHAVQVVDVTAGGEAAVIGLHGLARHEGVGNVLDVVAVVGLLRPTVLARFQALGTQLGGGRQGGDLHPGVVVIKLAIDRMALALQQLANGVAQGGLSAMAHVQRAGGVGRNKLHQDARFAAGLVPKGGARLQHLAHDVLMGCRLQAQIDETRPGDVHAVHPLGKRRSGLQIGAQPLCDLARGLTQGLGPLQGGGDGPIPMCRHFGRFQLGVVGVARHQRAQGLAQIGQQLLFDKKHRGAILRARLRAQGHTVSAQLFWLAWVDATCSHGFNSTVTWACRDTIDLPAWVGMGTVSAMALAMAMRARGMATAWRCSLRFRLWMA